MKKLSLLLFLTASTLFVSCGDDDDTPIVVDESLIPGEWSLTEIKSENGKASTNVQGLPVSGDYSISGKDYTAAFTLTESAAENEPNTFAGSGGLTLIATVTLPALDPIAEEQVIPDFLGSGEWTVTGNTFTTTVQEESLSYEITSLTEQSMVLKTTIDEEVTIGDFVVTVTGDQFLTLTKN